MDVINKWIHITTGISSFDVLVKEVGHKTYGIGCKLDSAAVGDTSCEEQKKSAIGNCTDVIDRSVRHTNPLEC
ncbi:hypothetical protein AHAS_Ahas17G0144900 [Arachis hypogaea]